VTAAAQIDPEQASEVGGRTLEVFSSTPRLNDWLYAKLARHIHGDVLEIGSGIGNLSRLIIQNASSVVLSDMEAHYLHALEQTFAGDPRVTVAPYDLEKDPGPQIADRRFDAIVAVNVIEHIRDDHALVSRLAGLLKPGGKLAVYVPACPSAYGSLDVALGHHRRYTPQSLDALLSGAGLLVEPPQYMNFLGLLGWTVNGRLLKRQRLSSRQIAVFERFMPLVTLVEDRIRLPVGLGVYTAAQRPG